MLSAALRGTPAAIGGQACSSNPRLQPPVLQPSQAAPRALASSYSSLTDEPIFDSPRAQTVEIPQPLRSSVHADADLEAQSSGDELEGDVFGAAEDFEDGPSASSSQTQHPQHLCLSTPSAPGLMASSLTTSTPATLQSAGPSGEFTIGRAAMGTKGSFGDLQSELEHLSSCGAARGSRPIGIPRGGAFMASTYHPGAGAFMQGFIPPHELAAASVQETEPMGAHSHRHKSIAERLRTAVFEQTGLMSVTTAAAFLQTAPVPPQRQQEQSMRP